MGMYETLIISNIKNKIVNYEQIKKHKEMKRLKKKEHKEMILKLFGRKRYNLSYWFGAWALYSWNNRDYSEILYQKFYKELKTANQYAERLKKKYTKVTIDEVYNNEKIKIGYMIYGKEEKIAETTQQPSNIINFAKYAKVK